MLRSIRPLVSFGSFLRTLSTKITADPKYLSTNPVAQFLKDGSMISEAQKSAVYNAANAWEHARYVFSTDGSESLDLFARVIEMCKADFGSEHELVKKASFSIGNLLLSNRKFFASEPYLKEAFELYSKTGTHTRDTAVAASRLGYLYMVTRRPNEAEQVYRATKEMHIPEAEGWANYALSTVMHVTERDAMDGYMKALEHYKAKADLVSEAIVLHNLGGYQQVTMRDLQPALDTFKRASVVCMSIPEAIKSPLSRDMLRVPRLDHDVEDLEMNAKVATAINGNIAIRMGQIHAANASDTLSPSQHFDRGLSLLHRVYPENAVEVAPLLHQVARFFASTRDSVKADGLYRHLLQILAKNVPGTVERKAQILLDYSKLLNDMKLSTVSSQRKFEGDKLRSLIAAASAKNDVIVVDYHDKSLNLDFEPRIFKWD